jgi:hypothetical protein
VKALWDEGTAPYGGRLPAESFFALLNRENVG